MHGIKQTFTKVKEGRQQQMVQFRRLSIGIITWLNWNKVQVDIILNTGDLPFPFESVREGFHKHSMIRLTVDDAMLSFQAHITLNQDYNRAEKHHELQLGKYLWCLRQGQKNCSVHICQKHEKSKTHDTMPIMHWFQRWNMSHFELSVH